MKKVFSAFILFISVHTSFAQTHSAITCEGMFVPATHTDTIMVLEVLSELIDKNRQLCDSVEQHITSTWLHIIADSLRYYAPIIASYGESLERDKCLNNKRLEYYKRHDASMRLLLKKHEATKEEYRFLWKTYEAEYLEMRIALRNRL